MRKNLTLLKSTLLALFVILGSANTWGQVYTQVTSTADLATGEYLVVGHGATSSGIMLNTASTAPIINFTAIEDPVSTIDAGFTAANVFTVTVSGTSLTIYQEGVGYVSWGNTGTGTANHAGFYNDTPTDKEKWSYELEDGRWTLRNVATPARVLSWNDEFPRFACYANTNQTMLSLYKRGGVVVERVAKPTISPAGGLFTDPFNVTIATATAGASIYYTTNDETPTSSSTKYTAAFQVSETTTVKAIAIKDGMDNSLVEEVTYTLKVDNEGGLTEDFEGDTGLASGYADGSFTNPATGIVWTFVHSKDQTGTQGEDFPIDGKGLMLRRAAEKSSLSATFPNGVGSFSFQYRKAYTGGAIRELALFVNGSQVTTTKEFGEGSGTQPDIYPLTHVINTPGSVTIKIENISTGQVTLDNISWTEYTSSTPVVAVPTFSPGSGTYTAAQNVALATTTAGASIYYTTDGNNPTTSSTKYTSPIAVNKTTTIKAMAVKDDMDNSAVVTATYTFETVTEVSNIAALRAATPGKYKLTGEAVVTLASSTRNTKFIQDSSGAIAIDDAAGVIKSTYQIGDGMKNIVGTTNLYNGLLQFVPEVDPGAPSSSGNTVTPQVVDLADLGSHQAQLVQIKAVTIDGTGNFAMSTSYNLNGESNPVLRTQYQLDYIGQAIPAGQLDIVGVVIPFGETIQFIPRSADEMVPFNDGVTVARPVITPASGTFFENQAVTITTATEGATIYYTTNGYDPTSKSKKYTEPIIVDETTTIKAFATKTGMANSAIATAEITIVILTGTEGAGTKVDPFTVQDVMHLGSTTGGTAKFWVKAFVIGNISDKSFPEELVLAGPFASQTNLVVATLKDETNPDKMLTVQLPSQSTAPGVRAALNLAENPENLRGEVLLYGTLEKYFGVAGIKNVTDYQILSTSSDVNSVYIQNLYTTPGMIHFNATAGDTIELYNLSGQKIVSIVAQHGLNSIPVHTQGVVILKVNNKVAKVIVK